MLCFMIPVTNTPNSNIKTFCRWILNDFCVHVHTQTFEYTLYSMSRVKGHTLDIKASKAFNASFATAALSGF